MARILVIDDETEVRNLLRTMLENDGHEVLEAADGKGGMELFKKNPTEIVITDIIMPRKDGIGVIKELRRDYPDAKIIAISGGGSTGTLNFLPAATSLGANYILPKPFTGKDLSEAISKALNTGEKEK